jgi:hypothetical protein
MKKRFLIAAALVALTTVASARDSLPREVQGIWCRDVNKSFINNTSEFFKTDDLRCPGDRLELSSYRLDMGYESSCDIMKVKVVERTYRVNSICSTEGDEYDNVDTVWLVNKTLRIKTNSSKMR